MTHLKLYLPIVLTGLGLFAQAPQPTVAPETVVATIDGKPLTAQEIDVFLSALPPQLQQNARRDKQELVRYYALMTKLARMAEEKKLDQQPQYKGRLEFARDNVLMQSMIEQEMNNSPISEDQITAELEKNNAENAQANTRVLYVAFGEKGDGRSEAEAKTKIEDLRKKAVAGEDFVKLIAENSDDKMSKENEGLYPPIKKSDALPDVIKNPIFTLKPGEYSEPIRQASGFYLFRLESLNSGNAQQDRQRVIARLRQQKFNEWFQGLRNTLDVKFENEAFFAPEAPAQGIPVPQQD